MKLRNKKTGEIGTPSSITIDDEIALVTENKIAYYYDSLDKLYEEWEDAPEEPKEHWEINTFGDVETVSKAYTDDMIDELREIGNYFDTREEAEQAVEKLKAWKRLKDNGFKFNGWKRDERHSGDFIITATDQTSCDDKDLDLLFGGEDE